jgi:hypothetical protein
VPETSTPSRLTRDTRPDIKLPDGRTLTPRARAAKKKGIHDRTLARKNPKTTYIGGVAYVDDDETSLDLAKDLKRRCEPVKPRRRSA